MAVQQKKQVAIYRGGGLPLRESSIIKRARQLKIFMLS